MAIIKTYHNQTNSKTYQLRAIPIPYFYGDYTKIKLNLMNIAVAFSRIFLVSTDSLFCQNFTSLIPSHFEVSIFPNGEKCFQNIHQRPGVIFFEKTQEEENQFLEQVLSFDKNIPIVLIKNNNNISNSKII